MKSVFFGSGAVPEERKPSNFVIPTPLGAEELRVLGCLIEKQFLTPDVYPLTLNALLTACNQKTSREPVVAYDDHTCITTLDSLQRRGLSTKITGGDNRVPKYREMLSEKTNMRVSELAILCVMMLRGPQTPGELRERTQRIHEFGTNEEVEETLDRMILREVQNLVVKLPKLSGQKDHRYAHLLAGPVSAEEYVASASMPVMAPRPQHDDRVTKLESEAAALRERVEQLEQAFAKFRQQFE